jgi:hypothetical protein
MTKKDFQKFQSTVQAQTSNFTEKIVCHEDRVCYKTGNCSALRGVKLAFFFGNEKTAVQIGSLKVVASNLSLSTRDDLNMQGDEYCIIGVLGSVVPESQGKLILGNLWMRNFLTIFDNEKQKMGFTVLVDQAELEATAKIVTWVIVCVVLAGAGLGAYLLIRWIKKIRNQRLNKALSAMETNEGDRLITTKRKSSFRL